MRAPRLKRLWWMIAAFCLVFGGPGLVSSQQVAFVTSVNGHADLGDSLDWPDNDGLVGIAAADAVCRNRALAAGLSNPTQFRAWISDSADDAYCRVFGPSSGGTVAADCGETALPTGAGPWVRTDGYPFLPTIEHALSLTGEAYAPLLDEFGVEQLNSDSGSQAMTGSNEHGVANPHTCTDWSSTTGDAGLGIPGVGTTGFWGSLSVGNCQSEQALLCLEVGSGTPLPPRHSAGRLAFRTSVQGPGELDQWSVYGIGSATGIDAGDAICRSLAGSAHLPYPETFKAWLSTDTINAVDRFTTDGPWRRIDGVPFADDIADLVSGRPFTSLTVSELGGYSHIAAFTGTNSDGTAHADNCSNWDSTTGQAAFGFSSAAWSWWTHASSRNCTNEYAIYCLQDSTNEVLFWSTLEDGTFDEWSAVTTGL